MMSKKNLIVLFIILVWLTAILIGLSLVIREGDLTRQLSASASYFGFAALIDGIYILMFLRKA